MSDIKLLIEVGMPEVAADYAVPGTGKSTPAPNSKPSVEEQVRYALECIESGFDSHREWIMLNKLFRDLMAMKKKSERVQNIIEMIRPTLAKYGYHSVSSEDK